MNIKQVFALTLISYACGSSGSGSLQVSPNNTILQNLYALSMNSSYFQTPNSSLSYLTLLLGLNTSCTSNLTRILNESSGNMTFFAPSDMAFRAVPGFPDFGPNFGENCLSSSSGSSGSGGAGGSGGVGLISRIFQSSPSGSSNQSSSCPMGCNDTSLALNATSPQLMSCLPLMLQYHLLNSSLTFNSTTFGFLNRSSYNLTVMPTMLNASCLVNLVNSSSGMVNATNETSGNVAPPVGMFQSSNGGDSGIMQNNQVLVFNISSSSNSSGSLLGGNPNAGGSRSGSSQNSNGFNVTILHGINTPANVTVFDIPSSNGVLHVIDALLIPPANMTDTINATYSSSDDSSGNNTSGSGSSSMLPSFLNQTELEKYSNMSGITIFLPDSNSLGNLNNTSNNNSTSSGSGSGSSSNFNLTNYIFPSLLYNNRSFEVIGNLSDGVFFQQNLTNLNGDNITILFGRNNAMLFNGSRVIQSDILMKNGVLHLFDASNSIFSSGGGGSSEPGNNSTVAASLGRILRQMI